VDLIIDQCCCDTGGNIHANFYELSGNVCIMLPLWPVYVVPSFRFFCYIFCCQCRCSKRIIFADRILWK